MLVNYFKKLRKLQKQKIYKQFIYQQIILDYMRSMVLRFIRQ